MKRSNKWWAHVTRKQRPAWRGWRRKARDSTSTHTNSYGTELQHHPTANRKNCTGRWVLKSRRKLREGASSSRGRKVPPHVLLNQPPGSKSAEWGTRETWRSLTAVGMKTACEERGARSSSCTRWGGPRRGRCHGCRILPAAAADSVSPWGNTKDTMRKVRFGGEKTGMWGKLVFKTISTKKTKKSWGKFSD